MNIDAVMMTWAFGLVTGMRHAFEPDHVAAMSTLVAEGHGSRRAARLGAWWGLGHTAALLAVGVALGAMRAELSPSVARVLEFGVALMLMALGVRAVRRGGAEMRRGPDAWHQHGPSAHHHPRQGRHVHVGRWALSPRAFLVGVVHGLAGSGALAALAMSEFDALPARLLFVALFGLGSVAAMAALSGLAGWHLARFASRPGVHAWMHVAAGALSLVVGLLWARPILLG
jgi:sulfite exporter TauE/SafE